MPAIILDLLSGVGALELVWFWPARRALAPQVDLPSEVIEFPTATTLTLASKTILSPNLSPIEVNYVLLFLPLAVLPLIILWTHIVIKSGRLSDVARALRCTLAGPATNITVVLTLVLSQPIYWQRWVSSCALGTASDALHVDALIVVLSLSCGLAQLSTQRTHRFYDSLLLIALSVIHALTLPTALSASTVTLLFGLTLVSADLNAGCDLVVTQGLLRTVDALGVAAPGPRAVRSSSLFTTVRRTLLSFRVPLAKMRFVMSWSAAPLNRKYTDEVALRFHREILSTIRKIQQRRIRTGSARKLQPIALVNDAAPPCVTSASRDSDISPAPIFSSRRELTGTSQFFEDDSDSDDGSETVTYERLRNRTDDIDASEHAAWDEWYKSGAAVPDAVGLDTLGVSSAYDGCSRDAARIDHPVVHGRARYVDATGKVVSARRDLDCETVPYKRLPIRRRALPVRRSKSGDTGESFRSNWSQLGSGP